MEIKEENLEIQPVEIIKIKKEKKRENLNKNENINKSIDKFDNIQIEDSFLYDGKIFKNYKRLNNYQKKDNIKRIIYKCINNRKNENFKKGTKNKSFCNATIIYIEPNKKVKSGYFLKKDHSSECKELDKNIKISKKENYKKKDEFIKLCEDVMNTSTIYDRNL